MTWRVARSLSLSLIRSQIHGDSIRLLFSLQIEVLFPSKGTINLTTGWVDLITLLENSHVLLSQLAFLWRKTRVNVMFVSIWWCSMGPVGIIVWSCAFLGERKSASPFKIWSWFLVVCVLRVLESRVWGWWTDWSYWGLMVCNGLGGDHRRSCVFLEKECESFQELELIACRGLHS